MSYHDLSSTTRAKGDIGFACGIFDLAHAGHRHFLLQCRTQCDFLIVAVNSDASARRLKGPNRPIWDINARMGPVRDYAQAVIPFEGDESGLIMAIRPAIVFKGWDHCTAPYFARNFGWKDLSPSDSMYSPKMVQISRLPGFSTTEILNESQRSGADSASR